MRVANQYYLTVRLDHITPKQPEAAVGVSDSPTGALTTFPDEKRRRSFAFFSTSLPGGNSEREPPESIPNSEVKTLSADDSLGPPHAKVGHCQAFILSPRSRSEFGGFFLA